MIVQEAVTINTIEYIKTYSDANRAVVRDGVSYVEALDPAGTDRQYTEGDPLPEPDETAAMLRLKALEHKQSVTDEAVQELILAVIGGDEE